MMGPIWSGIERQFNCGMKGSVLPKLPINANVLLTDGHTALGLATTISYRKPVLSFPELKDEFEDLEIDYSQHLYVYDAFILTLKKEQSFSFQTQVGICRINQPEIRKKMDQGIANNKQKFMEHIQKNNYIELLEYKKQIILQGPPGTGKTKLAKELAANISSRNLISDEKFLVRTLDVEFLKNNLKQGDIIEGKTISFTINKLDKKAIILQSEKSQPWRPSYNKIIKSFNGQLWLRKGRTGGYKPYEDAIAKHVFDNFYESIPDKSENLEKETEFVHLIQFHPSFTYEDFVRGIVSDINVESGQVLFRAENKILGRIIDDANNDLDRKYILIIDEINRANLSSVLGELIYALEYRGEEVESMYEVDESNKILLPPNLYIIGTMNTADRSVGHIDYAIRRRFAFVDILPERLEENDEIYFNTEGFNKVAQLFNPQNVSNEFPIKGVQLGHSYFIAKKSDAGNEAERDKIFALKMNFEVVPILLEYVTDGILIGKFAGQDITEYVSGLKI